MSWLQEAVGHHFIEVTLGVGDLATVGRRLGQVHLPHAQDDLVDQTGGIGHQATTPNTLFSLHPHRSKRSGCGGTAAG